MDNNINGPSKVSSLRQNLTTTQNSEGNQRPLHLHDESFQYVANFTIANGTALGLHPNLDGALVTTADVRYSPVDKRPGLGLHQAGDAHVRLVVVFGKGADGSTHVVTRHVRLGQALVCLAVQEVVDPFAYYVQIILAEVNGRIAHGLGHGLDDKIGEHWLAKGRCILHVGNVYI